MGRTLIRPLKKHSMKKFILLTLLSIGLFGIASAQTNPLQPRFDSTGFSGDNTGRVLSWSYSTIVNILPNDSNYIYPRHFVEIYRDTLNSIVADSSSIVFPSKYISARVCDEVKFLIQGPSGGVVNFYNTSPTVTMQSQGRVVLGAKGLATVTFVYNGTYYVESNRVIQ